MTRNAANAANATEVTQDVLRRCRALGFAVAGITRAEPTRWPDELRRWLRDGRHGEMAYLERHESLRRDPTRLLDGARSIICVGDRYDDGLPDTPAAPGTPRGRIARYARGADYHTVIRKRLHTLSDDLATRFTDARFRTCVDTAPLLEREHAARAGLGAIGKHTLLIERSVGSYLLLGAVLTTLDLTPSRPAPEDPCGTCTRCLDGCPTDAITPWSVDASRCISYLTIEHRSAIDERFHRAIGDWIFGCDVCQEVCPHNQPTERTRDAATNPAYAPRRTGFDLLDVLAWTETDRRAAFRQSALKRAKLGMMKRNALIAAGNTLADRPDPALRARVEAIARDDREPELVVETARTVLRRLPATGTPGAEAEGTEARRHEVRE